MKIGTIFTLLLLSVTTFTIHAEETATAEQVDMEALIELEMKKRQKLWGDINKQTGVVKLDQANAKLNLGERFYYINNTATEKVLSDLWGNPPGGGLDTLGMIFPVDTTPLDETSWGVVLEYNAEGYVKDEDAQNIDFDDMLKDMQEGTKQASKQRVEQGYEAVRLVGWAAQPYYNSATHKLHWAEEIQFGVGENASRTLNYNIQNLGRRGYIKMNFIADMAQLPLIQANVDDVLAMVEFEKGSTYEEFDPSLDKVAAYGIGALVAGKVLAKTGFLAKILLALKKFWIIIIIVIGGLFSKVFKRSKS